MKVKKNIKIKNKKKILKKTNSSLSKLASITTKSISNAFVNYKKSF